MGAANIIGILGAASYRGRYQMKIPTCLSLGSGRRLANHCHRVARLLVFLPLTMISAKDDVVSFSDIVEEHREVIIPIPSEIFNVLDKFAIGQNEWRRELQLPDKRDCQNRTHFALFMGRVVAEGFLAVEAKDAEAISTLGREVLEVAERLGLRQVVIKHSKSIIDSANAGDWDAVRKEFDLTRQTVRQEMEARRDQDLAQCVSVGGWFRGTEIVTSIIKKKFSADKAEILYQPDLIEHFTTTFKGIRNFRRDKRMQTLIGHLDQLQPLMSKDKIGPEDVAKIYQICQRAGRESISP